MRKIIKWKKFKENWMSENVNIIIAETIAQMEDNCIQKNQESNKVVLEQGNRKLDEKMMPEQENWIKIKSKKNKRQITKNTNISDMSYLTVIQVRILQQRKQNISLFLFDFAKSLR